MEYKIKTIDDIAKLITEDNVDGFAKDFEAWLRIVVDAKKVNIEGFDLECKEFTWIDDGKNGRVRQINITSADKS